MMYKLEKTLREMKRNGGITKEEIITFFKQYEQDKENGIDISESFARAVLISANTGVIDFVVKKMNLYHFDEIYSAGTIGLVNAVDSFDVTKDYQFSTYAVKCITNQIIAYLKQSEKLAKKQAVTISLNSEVEYSNRRNKVLVEEVVPSNEDVEQEVLDDIIINDNNKRLMKYIKHLKPLQQYVVIRAFGLFNTKKLTQLQIAEQLNMNRQYITHTLSDAKHLLKILFSNYDDLDLEEKIVYTDIMAMTYNVDFKNLNSIRNFYSYSYVKDELFILIHKVEDLYGRDYLLSLFNKITKQEAELIIFNFGLFGYKRLSAEKMSEKLGLSINTIYDYIKKAKKKFKKMLKSVVEGVELDTNLRV